MSETIQERIALVTGGSRGIGRACVLELARAGHKVVFTYSSDKTGADKTIEDVEKETGKKTIAIRSDVSNAESVDSLFTQIEQIYYLH